MWQTIKKRLKSKTYQAAIVMGIIGIVEMNFYMLQELLGEWFGASYIISAIIFMFLREITKESIDDKGE